MSKIADAEANATSLDGLVNDNGLITTLRNGPKPSWQYIVDQVYAQLGYAVAGSFVDGFTYTGIRQVGADASGNTWIYTGGEQNLPHVVPAGTVPSAPDYFQVSVNSADNVVLDNGENLQQAIDRLNMEVDDLDVDKNYVVDLVDATTSDNIVNCKSHSPSNGGVGGFYTYDSNILKSEHDGVKFVSPTVPYNNLGDYLKGVGETDPSGSGVWVCKSLPDKKPQVSFVIDDGLEAQYDDVPPVFEAYGLRCAFGVIPSLTADGVGRFSKSEVQDLNSRGYEIIAHSITDLRTTTSKALSQAEMNTAYQELSQYAKVNGYLASQSQLSDTAIEAGKELYDYLFSLTAAQSLSDVENALFSSNEYYRLSRVNIDGANSVLGIPAAQKAAINYKNIAIYEHLYTDVSALQSILAEITQYKAISIGVPRDSFDKSMPERLPSAQDKTAVQTDIFTSTAGVVNDRDDFLFFDPSATGANKVLQFERNIEAGLTYTFSANVIKNNPGDHNVSFGVHFLDSGGSIISQNSVETDTIFSIDTNESRRYFVTASAPSAAVEIRVFMRFEVLTDGVITINKPRLSLNKSILANHSIAQDFWVKQNLPVQDITVGRFDASYPSYTLQISDDDNFMYSVSSNVLSFKKSGVYSVSLYGSGVAPSATTGIVFAAFTSQNGSGRSIGVISGNDTQANFAGTTTVNVKAGDTMQVLIRAKSDQATNGVFSIAFSGLSALEVQKIG